MHSFPSLSADYISKSWVQWTSSFNRLSQRMQNKQTVAVAVFAIANSHLFLFLTLSSHLVDGVIEDLQLSDSHDRFLHRSVHLVVAAGSFISFNLLLSKLTKYRLSRLMISAISLVGVAARFFILKITEPELSNAFPWQKLEKEHSDSECFFLAEDHPTPPPFVLPHKPENRPSKKEDRQPDNFYLQNPILPRISLLPTKPDILPIDKDKPKIESKTPLEKKEDPAAVTALVTPQEKEKLEEIVTEKPLDERGRLIQKITKSKFDDELKLLAIAVIKGEENEPFPSLHRYWDSKSVKYLQYRHQFAQLFGSGLCDRFQAVRKEFVHKVYRRPPYRTELQWLSLPEIHNQIQKSLLSDSDKANCHIFGSGYYFHSTTGDGLEGILKSGQLEVRAARLYRGAFVAIKPFVFGHPYVFVFKKCIEHLRNLFHGFPEGSGNNDYWAGFSHDIPINEKTVAHILRKKDAPKSEDEITDLCVKFKRNFKVISEAEYTSKWKPKIDALNLGIPSHWGDSIHQDYVKPEIVELCSLENDEEGVS